MCGSARDDGDRDEPRQVAVQPHALQRDAEALEAESDDDRERLEQPAHLQHTHDAVA